MGPNQDEPTRAELLLAILQAGRKVYGTTKLQKLAFLVQEEMEDPAFEGIFDFQPYYYGPFTPEISEEIEDLQEEGLVRIDERETDRHGEKVTAQDYELTSAGQKRAQDCLSSLDRKPRRRMQELVEEYNFRSLSDLLEYTYEEYPEMAERSRWEGKT